ncbi:MAG: TolB family protein [Phototrophicaceae bacterium]
MTKTIPWKLGLLALIVMVSSGCNVIVSLPTETATPTPSATATVAATSTATLPPSATASPLPSATATLTLTPSVTPIPSNTPPPSSTPYPELSAFRLDNWELLDPLGLAVNGYPEQYVAFTNSNNRDDAGLLSARTPQPGTQVQRLYFSPSRNPAGRVLILEMPESTRNRVFLSPAGNGVAYFIDSGEALPAGLYLLDLETGVKARILAVNSLVQRGFLADPIWSADGAQIAIVLATEYATDIFIFPRNGSTPYNLTQSGAYDFFPAFSPDGRYLAFASDRADCPTWNPNTPNTCDGTDQLPPESGHLYVVELATGVVTRLSETKLTEPPRWINNRLIAYGEGQPLFGDPSRVLWVADVVTGQAREVRRATDANPLMLAESWSPDGSQVIYQDGNTNALVIASASGQIIAQNTELAYPRYGLAAGWSPDGTLIAIGGINEQCPYGATVLNPLLEFLARGNTPPSMCAPRYSSDGVWLAFRGVSLNNFDGRSDVYVANNNGFGALNLTGDLRGTMNFLGWVGE